MTEEINDLYKYVKSIGKAHLKELVEKVGCPLFTCSGKNGINVENVIKEILKEIQFSKLKKSEQKKLKLNNNRKSLNLYKVDINYNDGELIAMSLPSQ